MKVYILRIRDGATLAGSILAVSKTFQGATEAATRWSEAVQAVTTVEQHEVEE